MLFGIKSRVHRWFQEEVAKTLKEQGEITVGHGYYYNDQASHDNMVEFHVDSIDRLLLFYYNNQAPHKNMVEFHVDAIDRLLLLGNTAADFGVKFNVRCSVGYKPLISFGKMNPLIGKS